MEVTTHRTDDQLELRVTGMLDNNWSDHLASTIDDAIRKGHHHLRVNLSGVSYISSAGVAVLVRFHKELRSIQGTLCVCEPSREANEILRLMGLAKLLLSGEVPLPKEKGPAAAQPAVPAGEGAAADGHYDLAPGATLRCRTIGKPELIAGCRFQAEHSRRVTLGNDSFGIGLGAFGAGFDECRSRFGEFLAVAGAAAQLPTHRSGSPDYQVAAGDFVPSAEVLYGIVCEGNFARMARFEPNADEDLFSLSALVAQQLEASGATTAGIVIVAEAAGLVGAALRRSPAHEMAGVTALFQHPQIRDWLSFTPERAHQHSLALVVGVASRGEPTGPAAPLAPLLRPLTPAADVWGHFHAAAFAYRPLQKGELDLRATVGTLFDSGQLQGVLHLLADDRGVSGAGESEFVGGAIWTGAIADVTHEEN